MYQLSGLELKRFLRKIKNPKREVYLILENIQYATNVASIFRTAEAFKVKKIFLTGTTKTPPFGKELRKVSRNKEERVPWEYKTTGDAINKLRNKGYTIIALEITNESQYPERIADEKIALVLGNEAHGVVKKTLETVDKSMFIPMYGKGSSLSVGVAAGIALYSLTS